ncbi:MAG: LysR family transcriptional regulator [Peptococcaceae bacterium]
MRLEQFQQIVEIEKHQSISKAAKALFMAQSSLSGSLHSLEKEIGVRLFERTTAGVVPTPEGQDIIQLARQALDCASQMLNYGERHKELRGEVKLMITQSFGYLFSDIMVAFKRRFPKAELRLEIETPRRIVEALEQGQANLGLSMWGFLPEHTLNVFEQAALRYEAFKSHQMMLFVSQDSALANNEEVGMEEMQQEQFLSYSSVYWTGVNRHIQMDTEALVMNDREALKRMISAGEGVAILPESFAKRDIYCEQGMIRLIPIKGSENFGEATEYLLYPRKRQLTLLEQKTLELLRELLKENQP